MNEPREPDSVGDGGGPRTLSGPLAGLTYRALVAAAGARVTRSGTGSRIWHRAWDLAGRRLSGPVRTSIHGRPALVNAGYPYPAWVQRLPHYNDPLVELVHQVGRATREPVGLVDVGAAVGDTVLLVMERCPGVVGRVDCVEPDPEFHRYLVRNLADIPDVACYRALLSDREGLEASLVRNHPGTGSARGRAQVPATTLDALLAGAGGARVDVVKVDTDGFDGKVLAGSTALLARDLPAVIFEWHPQLCEATGQDWRLPFEVLTDSGYTTFLWFSKFGDFSHAGYEPEAVAVLADVCRSGAGPHPDWHYDVVGLPSGGVVPPGALAQLAFARSRPGGPARARATRHPSLRRSDVVQ